jgi:hypothetical protein
MSIPAPAICIACNKVIWGLASSCLECTGECLESILPVSDDPSFAPFSFWSFATSNFVQFACEPFIYVVEV